MHIYMHTFEFGIDVRKSIGKKLFKLHGFPWNCSKKGFVLKNYEIFYCYCEWICHENDNVQLTNCYAIWKIIIKILP